MPDLDIIPMRTCASNDRWEARVTGSSGGVYDVSYGPLHGDARYTHGWTCTCKGFKFRGGCTHIDKCKRLRCGWDEQWGGGGPEIGCLPDVQVVWDARRAGSDVKGDHCPMCGGATRIVRCAV